MAVRSAFPAVEGCGAGGRGVEGREVATVVGARCTMLSGRDGGRGDTAGAGPSSGSASTTVSGTRSVTSAVMFIGVTSPVRVAGDTVRATSMEEDSILVSVGSIGIAAALRAARGVSSSGRLCWPSARAAADVVVDVISRVTVAALTGVACVRTGVIGSVLSGLSASTRSAAFGTEGAATPPSTRSRNDVPSRASALLPAPPIWTESGATSPTNKAACAPPAITSAASLAVVEWAIIADPVR